MRWNDPARHWYLSIWLGICTLMQFPPAVVATPSRPNILFIFSDDHAAHAISAYGSRINKTPNIDRMANEGMRFDNCFVTNSLCGPSRAVILTGKYSHLNGFRRNGDRFDGSQHTFPKLLQPVGYQTAMIGKWHLKSDPTGFDYWNILIGQGTYYNPTMIQDGRRVKHEGYTSDIITNLALEWLEKKRDKSKPFLLMCQHKAPHRPWQPAPRYLSMYDSAKIPEPTTLFDDYSGGRMAAKLQNMTIAHTLTPFDLKLTPPKDLTPDQLKTWNREYEPKNKTFRDENLSGDDLVRWKYQRYIKDYLRCVASVDDSVGRLLDYLDKSGLAENTIVIYSSDQGWFLGEHGWFDKRWMYEPSLRMPLIVRWPGTVKPGSVDSHFVSNVDFAETFLDIAGVKPPADMQGHSIVPLLRAVSPKDWRTSFYYQYYEYPGPHHVRRHYGVRTDRYKLIYFYNLGEWELYDLYEDPNELQNLYGNPHYAMITERLKQELDRLRTELKVPPDNDPVPPEQTN
jgi:arylsulfatase A-like enzyme